MRTAYSYQRFSSIKQKEGDSTRRQNNAAAAFCQQHSLTLVDTFRDEGVSGFKGKNFSNESALGAFLKLVENGTVKKGSVLIVENMDRLSRQSILPCLGKFTDIIGMGISIGVISQNKILDEQSITANPWELMLVLTEFARANSESKAKSDRSKSIVTSKIERIKKGERVFISQKPTWIVGLKDGKFITDTKRVKVVQDAFRMYLAGDSCNSIANKYNTDKVPTLRGGDGIWTNSTVCTLLKNKNVIGWYGINDCEVDNYYPAIISTKDFSDTQTKLELNVKNRGGSKYGFIRNLFKGLCFCAECGQVLEVKIDSYTNVKGGLNHYAHYICRGVRQKTGCKNTGKVVVANVESAIFAYVLRKLPADLTASPVKESKLLADYEAELANNNLLIARYTEILAEPELSDMKHIIEGMKKAKQSVAGLTAKINQERMQLGQIQNMPEAANRLREHLLNGEWDLDIPAFNKAFGVADTEQRKMIKNIMPSVFSRLDFRFKVMLGKDGQNPLTTAAIDCTFIGGEKKSINVHS